tara:strand:+ start:117 stop:2390 length:2274 start_codon:yes stop_codon:yes gene_type:complete
VPLARIIFKPGVNRETTSYGAENGWYDSDLIRFRKGRPEKMGGWSRLSSTSFQGTGRSLHVWAALDSSKYMGLGTEFKFYIEQGGGYNDITPVRKTVTLGTNPFLSTAGNGIITVTDVGHGAVVNDFVTYSGATTFDGLTTGDLNQELQITQVIDANSYKVDTGGVASSGSVAGGGSVILAEYQINTGLNTVVSGTGFGAGFWGGVVSSYAATTLASGINSSVTSIPLTDASAFDTATTTLDGSITVFSSSIDLISASSFPDIGTIKINSEYIRYGTKTDNTLSDLSRNSDGSTIAGHTSGDTVTFVGLINIENELILYTGKTTNTLDAGVVRSARGTTNVSHSGGVVVKEANDFIGWGSPALTTASTGQNIRLWSQDNWGEDLFFNVYDGTPYYWDKTLGLTARATTIASQSGASDAPTIARRIMVSGADRHIIAFACNAQGATQQDLLQIRWSSQEAPFDWTPTVTNTAGAQRISSGSEIIAAQKTRQEILIWTDANLHAMRFVGPPLTFGFTLLASNISLVGPNAVTTVGDRVFWMDRENFYAYTGRIEIIPCTVLRYVFDDINLSQSFKFFAASNRMFDEVFWFYVSSGATEIDRYAKYNYTEGTWDIGTMVRTAWVDYSIHDNPRAAGTASGNEYIYIQETGTDADGDAMSSYIQSADFDLGDGNEFMFINRLIPDVDLTGTSATIDYVVKTRNFPGSSLSTNSTNAVTSTTDQNFLRARSRQAVIRIQSTTTDVAWTLGDLRLDLRPDGRR